jgi:hypothetical protein
MPSINKPQFTSQVALTMLFLGGLTVVADAQSVPPQVPTFNPSQSYTLPTAPEQPVSPNNPGTAPGSTLGSTGLNPITGLPCEGNGASATASAGSLPGTSTQTAQNPIGLPPSGSVYAGAC